jgi:PQQ-like domain
LALDVSPDGSRVFVTGGSQDAGTSFDYATVAYDTVTGEQLWVARYDGPTSGSDSAQVLAVSPDGSQVVVSGSSPGTGTSNDYATVAYDAETGEQLWAHRYDGPGHGADFAQDVSLSPDSSRVVVTGHSVRAAGDFDYATVAYDAASGEELWTARYNGPGNTADFATALAITPDSSTVVVTGEDFGGQASASDYATVAYDAATGDQRWVTRYNGAGSSGDAAETIAISPDGSQAVVSGQSTGDGTGPDFATIAYDTTDGSQEWVSIYNPVNGFDVAWAVEISPDGSRTFVTGQSTGAGSGLDFATVTYDSSDGSQLRTFRYNGPGNGTDVAQAMTVDPDGSRLFVSGYSLGLGSDLDFATVSYDIDP